MLHAKGKLLADLLTANLVCTAIHPLVPLLMVTCSKQVYKGQDKQYALCTATDCNIVRAWLLGFTCSLVQNHVGQKLSLSRIREQGCGVGRLPLLNLHKTS